MCVGVSQILLVQRKWGRGGGGRGINLTPCPQPFSVWIPEWYKMYDFNKLHLLTISTLTSQLFTPRRFGIQWCFLGDLFWVWLRFFQNLLPGFWRERGGVLPDWGPFVSWVGGALVLGSGGESGAEQGDG